MSRYVLSRTRLVRAYDMVVAYICLKFVFYVLSRHSIMKLAWCPLLHTPSGRTPGLQCEKAVETVFSWGLPSQISNCKTQTGCWVPRGEGLGPSGSHRVPPNPICVPSRKELGLTGTYGTRFGSYRAAGISSSLRGGSVGRGGTRCEGRRPHDSILKSH